MTYLVIVILSFIILYSFTADRNTGRNQETDIETEPEPEPEPEPSWNVLGDYKIRPDIWNEGNFSIPEKASKIRIWFDITLTPPNTEYIMQVRLVIDGVTIKDSNPFDGGGLYTLQTQVFEIDGVSGDFTLEILVAFARTEFTIEWYG